MTKNNWLFLFILTFLVSCVGNESKTLSSLEPSSGNLRLLATDAPFNFSAVNSAKITIGRIDLVKKNSGEKITVMESATTLDLINLKNGLVSTLVDLDLPAGEYNEIRLIIDASTISLTDGRVFNMTVPSGAQSGLKIFLNPAIAVSESMSSDVLLDFDLSRSFVPQGTTDNIHGFNFKPVIRASNLTTAGSVKGVVTSDNGTPQDFSDDLHLEGAIVTVEKDGVVIATAVTEANGFYQLIGLSEDSYTMKVTSDVHEVHEAFSVAVNAGNVTEEDFVLTRIPAPGPVTEPVSTTDSTSP